MKDKLVKCPVCGKKYWERIAIRNHIIRQAQVEGWKSLNNMFDSAKGKPYEFSPRVMLSHQLHLAYYRKNLKDIKIKKLIV